MKHFFPINVAILLIMIIFSFNSPTDAGTLEASCSAGVTDVDGVTYLFGSASGGGCYIQLIYVGGNGVIDYPDAFGNTTLDDSLLGTTYVGYGYPFNPDEGKFVKTFSHDLLSLNMQVYVRAWNDSIPINSEDYYGDSDIYTLQSDFDSYNFSSWQVNNLVVVPVELASFSVDPRPGYVSIEWTTQSETDNLGFHIFRSDTRNGQQEQVTTKIIDGAINSQVRHDYKWEDRSVEVDKNYFYWLADVAMDGSVYYHGPKSAYTVATPELYGLLQNYPNPFNPSTSLSYVLKSDGDVNLRIYNITGQLVRELVNCTQQTGEHIVEWNGRDAFGSLVPSGTYFYVLDVNGFTSIRKMSMMK